MIASTDSLYLPHTDQINVFTITQYIQSTLSKADTLGTKATLRFREVSALERVQLQRYKCNSAGSGPNLLSGLESVRLESWLYYM